MAPITTNSVVPPRQSGKRPLKRVVGISGAWGLRNYTIRDIRDLKGVRSLTQTCVFLPEEAAAAEEAGIDMLATRFVPGSEAEAIAIRQAAPHTIMGFGVPMSSVASEAEALRLAFDAMEAGADWIHCQWKLSFVATLAQAGIPVQGHVGLVPRKSTWTGGLRAVGKTVDEAMKVYQEIKDLERAGAWAVEIEVVPARLTAELTKRTSLTTVSTGAGPAGDIQLLFAQDLLGDGKPPFPRHGKQYCDLWKMRQKMQEMRVTAFKQFAEDVRGGDFPGPEHIVEIGEDVTEQFTEAVDR